MAENFTAMTPTATLSLAGSSSVLIGGFTLSAQLDAIPTLVVWPHPNVPAAQTALQIASKSVIQYLAKHQRDKFSQNPQTSLLLDSIDGQGVALKFSGLVTSPALQSSSNYYALQLHAQHFSGLLNTLRTNIYVQPDMAEDNTVKASAMTQDDMNQNSLAERLDVLLKVMIKQWGLTRVGQPNPVDAEIKITEAIHASNETPLALWQRVLDDSKATTELEVLKIITQTKGNNYLLNESIMKSLSHVYMENYNSFMDVVARICGLFQLRYVPGINMLDETGRAGRLIDYDTIVSKSPEAREVIITGFSPSLGVLDLLPVRQVLVQGNVAISRKINDETVPGFSQPPILGGWPFTGVSGSLSAGAGRIVNVSPPVWLSNKITPTTDAFLGELIAQKGPSTVAEIIHWSVRLQNEAADDNRIVSNLLSAWARNYYREIAIGNDTVTLHTALDYSWKLGVRYRITLQASADNTVPATPMFTGFLIGLQHTLKITLDKEGEAHTTLIFSHVMMDGFTLSTL